MPEHKPAPVPVQLALEAIALLMREDATLAVAAKKKLPGFAMRLTAAGEEVTVEGLVASARAGEIDRVAEQKQRPKTYADVKALLNAVDLQSDPKKLELEAIRKLVEAGDLEALKQMTAEGAKVGHINTLRSAASYGQLHIMKYLLHDLVVEMGAGPGYGEILAAAASQGHMDAVKYLVEEWGIYFSSGKACAQRELKKAGTNGNLALVKYFLEESGACPISGDNLDEAFIYASRNGHLDVVKYLFGLYRKYDPLHGKIRSVSAFDSAVSKGRLDIVKYFLDECGLKVTDRMYTAAAHGQLELLKYFIEERGFKFYEGVDKALARAVYEGSNLPKIKGGQGNLDVMHYLLDEHGASLSVLPAEIREELEYYFEACKHWQKVVHMDAPFSLPHCDPAFFKPVAYQAVKDMIAQDGMYYTDHNLVSRLAFNAAGLFGTEARVLQYLEKWGAAGKQPLHDVIQMIKLPEKKTPEMDLKAWGDAVLKCGKSMAKLVKFADRLPVPERTDDGRSWSMVKTREKVADFVYERASENSVLAGICFENDVDEREFNTALELSKNPPAMKSIPDITLEGEAFDMPGATFHRLAADDVRGLFLGEMTDCCQSIGGAGQECATQGFTSEDSGFYVIENAKGRVIGQTWAWRGKQGELVFDSLETLGKSVTSEQWIKLTEAFAQALSKKPEGVTAFNIGKSGATPHELIRAFKTAAAVKPKGYNGYRDSYCQVAVWQV